ncbi:MAG TPA: efflux RND transporter periplasmic adaptor subunit [Burkholderiaceae bacterium]|nr:efflux RND transporter periplasmic adaptor subunit [Burkholderiaceae bacterium]
MKKSTFGAVLLLAAGLALGAGGVYWWLAGAQPGMLAQHVPDVIVDDTTKDTGPDDALPATQPASPPSGDSIGVDVAAVESVSLARSVAAVGSLSSENSVMLRPEITGRITTINFVEGGPVSRGQTLIELDSSIEQAQLEQAQAALALASSQHRRAQELTRRGFISAQARDESASELKVRQAAVSMARAQLDKTVIKAPFDGLAGLRHVSVGDYVSPGSDLVLLESIDPLNVDFRIPEQFLGVVDVGTRILLRFDALPDVVREGVVGAISPLIDVGGRSILLRAKVPNDDGSLRPGMFARVQLQFDDKRALMVPETAIVPAGDMNYVFRVDGDHVARIGVVLGQRQQGKVEILDGLNDGDRVLVSGLQKVSDGARIHVLSLTGSD